MDGTPSPAAAAKAAQTVTSELGVDRAAAGIENPGALPNKSVASIPQEEHEAFGIMDKNMERHNTWDSLPGSLGRTSTGFSHMSTATELTEPDLATSHDDAEDMNASLSRRFTLACRSRTSTFQSSPPSRTPSFMADHNTGQIGRRAIHPEHMPGRPHPLSHSIPEQEDDEMDFQPSSPHSSEPAETPIETAEGCAADSPLPSETGVTPEDDEDWTPAELSSSQLSDASDHPFDPDTAPQQPDDKLVQDVSDKLLKHLFGVDLQDLAAVNAAAAAHESIRNCLSELFQIVPTSLAPLGSVLGVAGEPNQASTPPVAGGSGAQGAGSSGGNGNGSGNGGDFGRRPNGARHPSGDDFNSGDGPNNNGKRPRTDQPPEDKNYSCPFRKRNAVRFNVREHQNCAVQSFPDISQLKRHVKIFHGRKVVPGFPCPRCRRPMGSQQALQHHLSVSNDQICSFQEVPASGNPEDGIDARVEDLLNGRRANSKVDSWEILWKTLFPEDDPASIPEPGFVPPIEFEEVLADFHTTHHRDALKRQICEEKLWASRSGRDADAHVQALAEICERHIESVFEACRIIKLGNHPGRERRRRIQRPKGPQINLPVEPQVHNEASFTGGSGGGSPTSLGTAHSGGSWFHVGQTTTATGAPANMAQHPVISIPQNVFPAIQDAGVPGNMVLSSPVSPGDAARTPVQTRGGFHSHSPFYHNRGPSADSAVALDRTQVFQGGDIYQQRTSVFSAAPQSTFQDMNFPEQQTIGVDAIFPVSGPMTSMPSVQAGPALMSHQFPFGLGPGYGEFQQPGLDGDMDGRN